MMWECLCNFNCESIKLCLDKKKKWVTTNIGYIAFVAYQHDIMFIMQPKLEGYEAIQKPHILSNRWFMSHKQGVVFFVQIS